MEIIDTHSFSKSQIQRINECSEILCGENEIITAQQIREEWGNYLHINLEPMEWQALYKVPRELIEIYKISYRTAMVVVVKSLQLEKLTATVEVIGINDKKFQTPFNIEVNLINLWPTKAQFYDTIDALGTANCIDQLRFFYNYVWMPWDEDEDDDKNKDWVDEHLEDRIDMAHTLFKSPDSKVSHHLLELISEARSLRTYAEELSEIEDDELDSPSEELKTKLLFSVTRIKCIKNEVEHFASVKKCSISQGNESNERPKIYVVNQQITIKQAITYLSKIRDIFGQDVVITYANTLDFALSAWKSGDTIILYPGRHNVSSCIKVADNCTIQGICNANETVILSTNVVNNTLFSINGRGTLKNLTVAETSCLYAVSIRSGELLLENCVLSGGKYGVMLNSKCSVTIDSCVVSNFIEGVIGCNLSIIKISNNEIRYCDVGIALFSTTICDLKESTISQCKEYGLKIETNNLSDTFGDLNILDQMKNLTISGINVFDNKINVAILHVPALGLEDMPFSFNAMEITETS